MTAPTFADRLARARDHRFVGRRAECERFERMLAGQAEPVWLLHGPAGIGKSTLLQELARRAEAAGRITVRLDARTVSPTPQGWHEAMARACWPERAPAGADEATGRPPPGAVVLLDHAEALVALELWLRDEELPRWSADVLLVVAGRRPADPEWLTDAGWASLAAVTRLEPWSQEEAGEFLRAALGPGPDHATLLRQAGGWPLLLALLAQAERAGTPARGPGDDRSGLVRALIDRFAGDLAEPLQRRAVQALLMARALDPALLASATEADAAPALWRWLRGLPFVSADAESLQVHDLVREALPEGLPGDTAAERDALREALMSALARSVPLRGPAQAAQALRDWCFLLRATPTGPHLDHRHTDSHYLDRVRGPADEDALMAVIAARTGPATVACWRHWHARQPQATVLLRRRDGLVQGGALALELAAATPQDLAADPPAAALMAWLRARRAPRPGGSVCLLRLTVDASGDTLPQPMVTLGGLWLTRRNLTLAGADWIAAMHHNAEAMGALYATMTRYNWMHPEPSLAHDADGQRVGVFVRDLVSEPVPVAWRPGPVAPAAPGGGPATREAFAEAVRAALRHHLRDERLADNPLRECAAIGGAPHAPAALARLREWITDGVDALSRHPADLKFHHALRLTWLDPGRSQERVAEELGLPFNTYRYHLARGAERLAELLWRQAGDAAGTDPGAPPA